MELDVARTGVLSCDDMKRESTEWSQFFWFDTAVSHLPRILLIGDSIVVGHRETLAKRLRGRATLAAYATSKLVGDPAMSRELALALADGPVDLIVFNNGLHGLDAADDDYRRGLSSLVDTLRQSTTARLVWRNCTPITVPGRPGALGQANAIVERRNAIAADVMEAAGIPVLDLYAEMRAHPEYASGDGYHYNDLGQTAQAALLDRGLSPLLASLTATVELNGFKTDFPGRVSDWLGFRRHDFTVNGIPCVLVAPNVPPDPARRWLWRVRFFGAFPSADLALLKLGWHVANIDIAELYGSPESNRRCDTLHAFLAALGFCRKCALAGFSRGGLDAYLWAARNPGKVACLYLDNAVCDFKSWPGGRGKSPGDPESWRRCLAAWGFTEEQALAFRGNPVDTLEPLAAAGIPVLHVCAEADDAVPPAENTDRVERRYRELGGDIRVIRKPGAGHHPHGLPDPQPIIDFILDASSQSVETGKQ